MEQGKGGKSGSQVCAALLRHFQLSFFACSPFPLCSSSITVLLPLLLGPSTGAIQNFWIQRTVSHVWDDSEMQQQDTHLQYVRDKGYYYMAAPYQQLLGLQDCHKQLGLCCRAI
jgi:hypothetical protein